MAIPSSQSQNHYLMVEERYFWGDYRASLPWAAVSEYSITATEK